MPLKLSGIVLNSPDPPALACFYSRLLGWRIVHESPEWVKLENPDGGTSLAVQIEDIYVPPVWPAAPGEQQMMLHLDILAEDLEAASARRGTAEPSSPRSSRRRTSVFTWIRTAIHSACSSRGRSAPSGSNQPSLPAQVAL
jgi:hypothetical protein